MEERKKKKKKTRQGSSKKDLSGESFVRDFSEETAKEINEAGSAARAEFTKNVEEDRPPVRRNEGLNTQTTLRMRRKESSDNRVSLVVSKPDSSKDTKIEDDNTLPVACPRDTLADSERSRCEHDEEVAISTENTEASDKPDRCTESGIDDDPAPLPQSSELTVCGKPIPQAADRNVPLETAAGDKLTPPDEEPSGLCEKSIPATHGKKKKKKKKKKKTEEREAVITSGSEVYSELVEKMTASSKGQEGGSMDNKRDQIMMSNEGTEGVLPVKTGVPIPCKAEEMHDDEDTKITERLLESGDNVDDEDCQADETVKDDEVPLLSSQSKERNAFCIYKLMYGVGLQTLRKLFQEIHPTWSNQSSDAMALDRGKMKLKSHEEARYKTGNLEEWDFALMTTVLLYSKKSSVEIAKRVGYTAALNSLKDYRNRLVGHPPNDKVSDSQFNLDWTKITQCFMTLGANQDTIDNILSDDILTSGKFYRDMFLSEIAANATHRKALEEIKDKLDTVLAGQAQSKPGSSAFTVRPNEFTGLKWDEWLTFCDNMHNFDFSQNQYILVTDKANSMHEYSKEFAILRSVPWKLVLDFDPKSEEAGCYQEFTSEEGQNTLVNMLTPSELRQYTTANLLRRIDSKKTQWVFVNGRESDTNKRPDSFPEWEGSSVKQLSRLFGCLSDPDKLDKQKAVICLVLPFCEETVPYLDVTMHRLHENFDEFHLSVVAVSHEFSHMIPREPQVTNLSPGLLAHGLLTIFSAAGTCGYSMPTSQAKLPIKLTQNQYLYFKEYLDLLYFGCEDLPDVSGNSDGDVRLEEIFDKHRESFMSGNWISFVSLYDNHDARRDIGNEIRTHLQRLLDQNPPRRSVAVQIRHSPGSGGSTIARRVLWDLHRSYPCAFANLDTHSDVDEGNTFTLNLVECIATLGNMCESPPVILLDGKHRRIEGMMNRVARMLNTKGAKAILVNCLHGTGVSLKEASSRSHDIHTVFSVNVKLEESLNDLREFQLKYKELIEKSLNDKHSSSLCRRVFHFPLLAMMDKFRPKLEEIVSETFEGMDGVNQEIAVVVAFIQKYANHGTPALLLFDAFKNYTRLCVDPKRGATYQDIRQLFTDNLLNLMVPASPTRHRYFQLPSSEIAPETYTLQHPAVADLVLKKVKAQKRDTVAVTSEFLQFPIYHHECFMSLFQDLFLHNKHGQKKLKFSLLFEELKSIDQNRAAEIFCEAAVKTNDPTVFANAARFHAKKVPAAFPQAKRLIERGFVADTSKTRTQALFNTKGVVLYIEMMGSLGKVKHLDQLEQLATEALDAFHKARNFPPTFPNPLQGEVQVWLACIEWIMKNICDRDSDRTMEFISSKAPPFFRTCISTSFYLLDIIDRIVQSYSHLLDPEETSRRANDARLSLMRTFRKGRPATGSRGAVNDVVQACKALCSKQHFPKSSQAELKRLQAQYILSSSDQVEALKREDLEYLLRLLEELVITEKDYLLAYHLMKVCILVTGPQCYTLERGVIIAEKWREVSPQDYLPHFYLMAIYFLKVFDGAQLESRPKYQKALEMCREKSQNHYRRLNASLFVGKDGQGMSRLITRSTLFRGESDYSTDNSEAVTKFWSSESRKKLLECKGRIRVSSQSRVRGRAQPYIELVQGNVPLYVGKSADIGRAELDFPPGSLVYFVVSFNLLGPVANGITFKPQSSA